MKGIVFQQTLFQPSLSISSPKELKQERVRNRKLVKNLLAQWHGTLPPPQGWKVAFALLKDGTIVGISTFGRPVARLENQDETMEHTRMALSPHVPKNTASYFMGQNRKWIRENMPQIKRLIAYVDLEHHTGVTYRSDNWKTIYWGKKNDSNWTSREKRTCLGAGTRAKFETIP